MSVQNSKMPKLIDKLEEKKALEEKLDEVVNEVSELEEPKKVKIKRTSSKKA